MIKKRYNEKIKLWVRYVDDVLIIWEGRKEELEIFINGVNSINQNKKFKEEVGGKGINYLDLNIKINEEKKLDFDIFRRKMYSDIIILNESYHPHKYKMAAINYFCYRALKCFKN